MATSHTSREQQPQQPSSASVDGRVPRGSAATNSVLELQRLVGNRAVARILARRPQTRPRGFEGHGKHRPSDVAYAAEVGRADAARLWGEASLSSAEKADIDAKLAWFQAAAHEAYLAEVRPALVWLNRPETDMTPEATADQARRRERGRTGDLEQINKWLSSIQKMKAERVVAWKGNADLPESDLVLTVLEIVVSIVSEGIGGVLYGVIDDRIRDDFPHLLVEFASLAGLEAGDLAAEGAFHKAFELSQYDLEQGRQKAAKLTGKSSREALASCGDWLTAYVEALKLHSIVEEAEQAKAFNASSKDMTDEDVASTAAFLEVEFKLIDTRLGAVPP